VAAHYDSGTEHFHFATMADLPEIIDMLGSAEVGKWLWFLPAEPEDLDAFFRPLLEAQHSALHHEELPANAVFVVRTPEGEFLGQGAAVSVEGSPGGVEIGYQLPRASWGRGIGRRLAEFLRAYALVTAGAERLQGDCLAGNVASCHILEGLGLVREGTRRGFRIKGITRHDEALFGALRDDLPMAEVEAQARAFGLRRGRR
jgi:RimJ/RimL family protein N-acetyltransferase